MGGKKRGSVRQKRRADVAAAQLTLATTTAGRVVESKPDESLFVIDGVGNDPLRKRLASDVRKKRERKEKLPEQLELRVKKLLRTHDVDRIALLAKQGRKRLDLSELKKSRSRKKNKTNGAFDLWSADNGNNNANRDKVVPVTRGVAPSMGGTAPMVMAPQSKDLRDNPHLVPSKKLAKSREMAKKKARPTVAVDVAMPGQSYRPDKEHHQDAIGEALAIELQRKEAQEYKAAPVTASSSLPVNDDDDTDDSDDDDNMDTTTALPKKKPEKLTKAQRNKKRRVREQELSAQARKKQRLVMHDVTEVKKITKQLSKHERECVERRRVIQQAKEEERAIPLGTDLYKKMDPLHVPALPVALTEELTNTSLRTVKPKGSIMLERLQSLTHRKMANRKSLHKKKNIVQGKKRKTMIKGGGNSNHDDFY